MMYRTHNYKWQAMKLHESEEKSIVASINMND
jgi:hypothetical protein